MKDSTFPMSTWVRENAEAAFGGRRDSSVQGTLPFLLKVLAIERPLSIQVHPDEQQALRYLRRCSGRGEVPVFADASGKPEMVVALSSTRVLVGLRDYANVVDDLVAIGSRQAIKLAERLRAWRDIKEFIAAVLHETPEQDTILGLLRLQQSEPRHTTLSAVALLAREYRDDPGVLIALAMHHVILDPGEALFVDTGVLHSYQSGFAIEIMATSDNVVRAGLTEKHVEPDLLLELMSSDVRVPEKVKAREIGSLGHYPTSIRDFRLDIVRFGTADIAEGPRILLVIEGEASLESAAGSVSLRVGEALFVPATAGPVRVATDGKVVVAGLGSG